MKQKALQIAVLISPVHDCLNPVAIDPAAKGPLPSSLRWILNPCDAFALEAALRLCERIPGTRTHAIGLASPESERVLREPLAVGIDGATCVWDPSLEGSDPYAVALVLAEVLGRQSFELILAGARRSDLENGQVGPMVAERLGLPQITAAREILPGRQPGEIRVRKRVPGQILTVSCPLPALVTLEKGPDLRYPRFIDRKRAQKTALSRVDLRATGLSASQVGASGSLTQVERITPPKPARRSALGSAVSGMTTAARLQRIMAGGLQDRKENRIWPCKDRRAAAEVVAHMLKEKMVVL